MKNLVFGTMSILVLTLTIFEGAALATGGFCRGVQSGAAICQASK
jgi:hypothetical protein